MKFVNFIVLVSRFQFADHAHSTDKHLLISNRDLMDYVPALPVFEIYVNFTTIFDCFAHAVTKRNPQK